MFRNLRIRFDEIGTGITGASFSRFAPTLDPVIPFKPNRSVSENSKLIPGLNSPANLTIILLKKKPGPTQHHKILIIHYEL